VTVPLPPDSLGAQSRPLRSWMFVPCNRRRFLEKIYEPGAQPDGVFLDLEDGVVPEAKQSARENAAALLREARPGPFRAVRINAVGSGWFEQDVDAVVGHGLEGLCIPKVESAGDLRPVLEVLDRLDPGGSVRIIAAIESAAGLLEAPAIAAAHDRILAIMFGAEDYALDVGLSTKREAESAELVYARSAIVVAATAARVISIDGVFPDLDDPAGLLADIVRARRLGFRAKSTFNPRQVELINEHFSPTEDELEYARRVVAAFEQAVERGDASVAVGGQLVDLPIVRRAEALLALADRVAQERAASRSVGDTGLEVG
jgi:citrate lyase subunit beta / citryl-CoA lyase